MSASSAIPSGRTGEPREVPVVGRNERADEPARKGVESFDPTRAKEAIARSGVVAGVDKVNPKEDVPHADAAWTWFKTRMNSAKYWVAPMVDQSELAFRMLCKEHGAEAAYTPMLHARIFNEHAAYREEHFTSTFDHPAKDRPLLAQFCANDPEILLDAARRVEPYVDGVDINLGCPQRIAKKGKYGSFLMNDIPLVESMVKKLAENLSVPVTVKLLLAASKVPGSHSEDVKKTLASIGIDKTAVVDPLPGATESKTFEEALQKSQQPTP